MLRRCKGWDYRQPCIYQITLVTADRSAKPLGRLVIDRDGAGLPPRQRDGEARLAAARPVPGAGAPGFSARLVKAHVELSAAGEAVMKEWRLIASHHPEIKPLLSQIMPDHAHFIIQVVRPMAKPLGNAIGGFKTGSSKAATGGPGLWAEGFQDTILFHAGQLGSMFNYLHDNPRRLAVKTLAPWLFKVRRELEIAPGVFMAAIGNESLLSAPVRLQAQCSRSDFAYAREPKRGGGTKIVRDEAGVPAVAMATAAFEEKCGRLVAAAKHGAVIVSPCISDGEREIARMVFAERGAIISLRNMGFSPLYKPGGKMFETAADGRLLILAPLNWPYQPGEKRMTRLDACVLNRLAQTIAGEGAAEINYKGMKPADIDLLVAEAAGKRFLKAVIE